MLTVTHVRHKDTNIRRGHYGFFDDSNFKSR